METTSCNILVFGSEDNKGVTINQPINGQPSYMTKDIRQFVNSLHKSVKSSSDLATMIFEWDDCKNGRIIRSDNKINVDYYYVLLPNENKYTLKIYKMKTLRDAFGIVCSNELTDTLINQLFNNYKENELGIAPIERVLDIDFVSEDEFETIEVKRLTEGIFSEEWEGAYVELFNFAKLASVDGVVIEPRDIRVYNKEYKGMDVSKATNAFHNEYEGVKPFLASGEYSLMDCGILQNGHKFTTIWWLEIEGSNPNTHDRLTIPINPNGTIKIVRK